MTTNGLSTVSSWKQDTFSTSDKKIDLQINHSFWSQGNLGETSGWVVANVTVTNTGNIPLKDVKVYIDVDDDSQEFDAHICDSTGVITDAVDTPFLQFGDIAPGVTSTQKSYWWLVKPRFPGSTGSATKTANFVLYPTFTADFRQSGQGFTSLTQLNNA